MYRGQRNKLNNRKETVGQIQNEGHPTEKKKKKRASFLEHNDV